VEETPLIAAPRRRTSRTLTVWRESRPLPVYLMVIAAAPLAYYDLGRAACGLAEVPGCVPQSVYVAPEVRDFLPGPFTSAPRMVDYFSSVIGPFPYEKLAHLQSSTIFGGMENATVIFYSDRGFRQRTMGRGVIAHETAHQWFGDAVTEAEWAHLWLSEGFASYFEQLWWQHESGDSVFREGMRGLRDEIVGSAVTMKRPVIDSSETDYLKLLNTNSYQKGAWVLHMLRDVVGDSAFFGAIRRYYLAHRHGNALTDDFERAAEEVSGRDLGWFFDQWLRRPGFADLALRWRYDERRRRVFIDVEQGRRVPPYRFPLTVEVRDAGGGVRRATLEITATPVQRVEVPLDLDAPPRDVIPDPDTRLLASFTIS
jgi:aminopeptidase N